MKTLVVKIGTSTLVRGGHIDESYIREVARQVAELRDSWRVVVVSSGAVRAGLDVIGRARAVKLSEKQAAAAIGQSLLMRAYRRAFEPHAVSVAQVLLTRADLADRRRFLNARHTMTQLFAWGVVPIVNENDTVATDELRFGDNDSLASLTALVCEADMVLLLSDVRAFLLHGEPLSRVERVTPDIEAAAGGAGTVGGTGGMRTKLEAARIATRAGLDLVIAHGREENVIARVANGEELGTRFVASQSGILRGRKRWIAFGMPPAGEVFLNPCARQALHERGVSLLPVGVEEVRGEFPVGALITIRDEQGEIGRGICSLSSEQVRRVMGLKSHEAARLLGENVATEVVHRDNLSLSEKV